MNYERLCSIISLAGIIICFMNIQKAILIGVSWLLLFSIGSMVAGIIQSPLEWMDRIHQIGLFTLLGFYLFCIVKNRQYIQDGWMPDHWYIYSYFVVGLAGASILTTMRYKETSKEGWLTITYFLETCLFVFVFMEYIICTFFRTDGFKV
jgi:hypothetical protein